MRHFVCTCASSCVACNLVVARLRDLIRPDLSPSSFSQCVPTCPTNESPYSRRARQPSPAHLRNRTPRSTSRGVHPRPTRPSLCHLWDRLFDRSAPRRDERSRIREGQRGASEEGVTREPTLRLIPCASR